MNWVQFLSSSTSGMKNFNNHNSSHCTGVLPIILIYKVMSKPIAAFIALALLLSVTFLFYTRVATLDVGTWNSNNVNSMAWVARHDEDDVVHAFRERIDRVKNTCKKYHLGQYSYSNRSNDLHIKDSPTPQYSYFYINKNANLAWCPVYKAGSTSWLHNMMILAGFAQEAIANPSMQLSIWARDVYGDGEPGQMFDNAVKLLVVRHPFTRLISAFRDKLSNASVGLEHGTEHFYNKYGKEIVNNFRNKNSSRFQREPTFEEFVKYLLKTDFVLYDDHWMPVYYTCTPCRVSYHYIATIETYQRDQNYIIEREELGDRLKPKWKHRTSKIKDTDEEARQYFSMLTKSQVYGLVNKYRMDFELFGYTYNKYLQYAK